MFFRNSASRTRMPRVASIAAALASIALVGVAASPRDAQARTYKVIHAFCQEMDCTDGDVPGAVLLDGTGRLFGTTQHGGTAQFAAFGGGTVFVLKPNKNGGYSHKVLYEFCPAMDCPDGHGPLGGLIMDGEGNLFGTTSSGGASNKGTVFALFYDAAAKTYTQKVLYSFCAQANCVDGFQPIRGLTMDAAGTLFGVTSRSLSSGDGVVFKLVPNKKKTRWTFTALHTLAVGSNADTTLLLDQGGNLFGSTISGGAKDGGTVFQLAFNKSKGTYAYRLLYSFCSTGGSDCTDGSNPQQGNVPMSMLADGSLIGTTSEGGEHFEGTVFRLTPPGTANTNTKAKWTQTILYSFCSTGGADCTDGADPRANPLMDSKGNLFGTTRVGGMDDRGVLYQLVFSKSKGTYTRRTLHKFCLEPDCTDGRTPFEPGLVMDGAGNLFGAAISSGYGVVYELVND